MFAELPLDNRTVNKLAALAATSGPSKPTWNAVTIETT
jgi:hypothetical protein